jgi:hypothetical protein
MQTEKAKNYPTSKRITQLSHILSLIIILYSAVQIVQWLDWRTHAPVVLDISTETMSLSESRRQYEMEVRYRDPDGDAFAVDWRILKTTIIGDTVRVNDVNLIQSPESQRAGTVFSNDWTCANVLCTLSI